jgi:hypothetical protein
VTPRRNGIDGKSFGARLELAVTRDRKSGWGDAEVFTHVADEDAPAGGEEGREVRRPEQFILL